MDLTSQGCHGRTYAVFGDTPEYQWVVKNAHKYGFIYGVENKTNIIKQMNRGISVM
ncbi:MAG: hypothetical protein ACLRL6_07840 [Clostridium sp.]